MLHHMDGRLRLSSVSRFEPALEREFAEVYYARVVPSLRLVAPFMVLLLFVGLQLSKRTPAIYDLTVAIPQLVFWTVVFGLTWVKRLGRYWQPALVFAALLMSVCVLVPLVPALVKETTAGTNISGQVPTLAQQRFYFVLQFAILFIPLAMLRLQFFWSALLYLGVIFVGFNAWTAGFPPPDNFTGVLLDLHYTIVPVLFVLASMLLTAFLQDGATRIAFFAAHQLEEERNDERRRHKQTEGKLHVLAQAIGGIVHDLGNPLSAVQMGSSTLEIFLEDEEPDKALLTQFAHSISDGAHMLDFLRLSLIEQTRVLEGKPTPIDPHPAELRAILASSVRFQKPHVLGKRTVLVQDGEATLHVDEMKMVTVWMNLIGNALKYSDGNVQVRWREYRGAEGSCLLVAVADQGTKGHGISRTNAAKLFSPFGRLDAHSQIEGTGLGLLSVQKIMEAHGGQVWIEGLEDGTPESPPFSTGRPELPAMLESGDRTAFVVSCPLASSQKPKPKVQMSEQPLRETQLVG